MSSMQPEAIQLPNKPFEAKSATPEDYLVYSALDIERFNMFRHLKPLQYSNHLDSISFLS